jgi:hypothetical protein
LAFIGKSTISPKNTYTPSSRHTPEKKNSASPTGVSTFQPRYMSWSTRRPQRSDHVNGLFIAHPGWYLARVYYVWIGFL